MSRRLLAKIVLLMIFGVFSVMIITALIHMIAPYVAAFATLCILIWIGLKLSPPEKVPKDRQDR